MIKEFNEYVSNYDMSNINIKFKYSHSLRVRSLNKIYAKLLNFSEEDIALAELIGLLHDIGRFEQIRIYNSINDHETIDHADLGIKILFEDGLIKKFWNNEEDYEIIKFAIKNHNKYEIPVVDDARMLKQAKLIRDSDKIDILYLLGVIDELNTRATTEEITEGIIDSIKNHELVDTSKRKNVNDDIASKYGYVYDMNYDICLRDLKKNFESYYETVGNQEIFKDIYDEVNSYIDSRLEKYNIEILTLD